MGPVPLLGNPVWCGKEAGGGGSGHPGWHWVFAEQGSGRLVLTCFLSVAIAVWVQEDREDSFKWSSSLFLLQGTLLCFLENN